MADKAPYRSSLRAQNSGQVSHLGSRQFYLQLLRAVSLVRAHPDAGAAALLFSIRATCWN